MPPGHLRWKYRYFRFIYRMLSSWVQFSVHNCKFRLVKARAGSGENDAGTFPAKYFRLILKQKKWKKYKFFVI